MKMEMIAIGDELINGFRTNTNGAFIGKHLFEAGFSLYLQTVVPDDFQVLQKTLNEALIRSDVVLATGGLGPTIDDITRDAVIDLFKLKTSISEELLEDLNIRFGRNVPSLINQATVPNEATLLKNPVGTAPGLVLNVLDSILILMPGVPKEMEPMFINQVIPFLKKRFKQEKKHAETIYLYQLIESTVDPMLRQLQKDHLKVVFGIYPAEGKLVIVIKAEDIDALKLCEAAILKEFKEYVLDKKCLIEEAIYDEFTNKKLFLSLAESCTGGNIAAKLTTVSGASNYFLGGVVPYSNALKTKWLFVSDDTLKKEGAVSKKCVYEMAKSLLQETMSDYSLAVSGVAGPLGGTPEKPVGTVFGAIGCQLTGEIKTFEFFIPGNRHIVIESTANQMLFELYKIVK